MMQMRTRATEVVSGAGEGENEWEVRPGGMLVQKRDPDAETDRIPPPTIRVRVKYGSVYHEININSQATFGELKKMLSGPTGLHHEDQKLMYKDKVRDSKSYLDVVGVKDRSKMVVVEDPISQEKRHLEMRKKAKMEKAAKSISDISFEVDRLAGQVSAFESVISKGGKVAEKSLMNLTELLMNQLLKLDGITVDGDVKLQRKMQVKRVQGYVEKLDDLKLKNSTGNHVQEPRDQTHPQSRRTIASSSSTPVVAVDRHQPPSSGGVMVTTQWELFDSLAAPVPTPTPAPTSKEITHILIKWNPKWVLKGCIFINGFRTRLQRQ
ncbi:hypothetical protein OSB04_025666 [Centaurea solstitialis]|uniref:Uncharacterized protein n=1 Tax=Centaurea solstitialis TaxID=347529 RepID=A0AA38WDA9_9ASTR|nr:hypothetical protein OSB04_025666 [Centaurea solstitialis]